MEASFSRFMGVAAVALFAGALFATNYYVDAENGNDAWDGSSATRGEGDVGPKETLAGVMGISGLTSGSIVYAAEGYYTNKVMGTAPELYRVKVPSGVKLIASGRADRTFIIGESSQASKEDGGDGYGNGPGAVRCVNLAKNAHVIGFTLTGGRTPATASDTTCNGGAVYGTATFYVTDCIVSNNMSYFRGGAFGTGGVITRCLLTKNRAPNTRVGQSMQNGTAYNCLCKDAGDSYHFYSSTIYNCTFTGPGTSARNGTAYNCICLVSDGGQSLKFYNSYLVDLSSSAVTNNCVKTTAALLALDENYRPKPGSVAIDAGNPSYYSLPAAVGADKDYSGGVRVIGSLGIRLARSERCRRDRVFDSNCRGRRKAERMEELHERKACDRVHLWKRYGCVRRSCGWRLGDDGDGGYQLHPAADHRSRTA